MGKSMPEESKALLLALAGIVGFGAAITASQLHEESRRDLRKKACLVMQNDGIFDVDAFPFGDHFSEPSVHTVQQTCARNGVELREAEIREAIVRAVRAGKTVAPSLLAELFDPSSTKKEEK